MRFSVSRRHVCAGEKKRILRKSAFWGLTSRKDAFCELQANRVRFSVRPNVQNALFREVCSAGAGQTALFRHVAATDCAFP